MVVYIFNLSAPYIGIGAILIQFIGYLVTLLLPICLVVFFLNQDYLKHPLETESPNPEQGIELQIVEA